MNVLVTGGSGLLGKYLIQTVPDIFNVKATYCNNSMCDYKMDITNDNDIERVLKDFKPDVVIHCAGNGNVDFAENKPDEARKINFYGTLKLCKQLALFDNPFLIYISSNAVYDGENPFYSEKNLQYPVNEYGYSKMWTETYLKSNYKNSVIIRPFMLYGWNNKNERNNWATTLYDRLSDNQKTKLVGDVYWQFTWVKDVSEFIWFMTKHQTPNESYNISSNETITLYEFGLLFADVFDFDSDLIEPVKSSYFENIAPRPKDTSYKLDKIKNMGFKLTPIYEGLKKMKEEKNV